MIHRTFLARLAICATLAAACAAPLSAIEIAVGLEGIADWGTSLPFKDAMRMAREWRVVDAADNWDFPHGHLGRDDSGDPFKTFPVDENGWPTQIPYNGKNICALMLVALPPQAFPFGTFTLLFEGSGTIRLGWDAGGPAPANHTDGFWPQGHGHTVTGSGGETRFEFSIPNASAFFGKYAGAGNSSGINLHITESVQGDHIRNIRVIVPDAAGGTSNVDTEPSQPFNPVFLEDIYPFTNYRLMDWAAAFSSQESDWSQRMRPDYCWASREKLGSYSVPWEFSIMLANITQRDIWLCLPYRADNTAYMAAFASFVKNNINAESRIFLEYGNEIWNTAPPYMPQHGYVAHQGSLKGWGNWQDYYVHASLRLFEAFEAEFGANSPRLEKIICGHHNNTGLASSLLSRVKNSAINPNATRITAYATAPYIGHSANDLAGVRSFIGEIGSLTATNRQNITNADLGYPVRFLTYEGGQHMTGRNSVIPTNRDPGMYQLYLDYVNALATNGIEMFNQFVAVSHWTNEWGAWGAKEYVGQPLSEAHKYRACYDLALANNQFDPNATRPWDGYTSITPAPRVPTAAAHPAGNHHAAARGAYDIAGRRSTTVPGGTRITVSEKGTLHLVSPQEKIAR